MGRLTIILAILLQGAFAFAAQSIDVVLVDTGLRETMSGYLNMEKNDLTPESLSREYHTGKPITNSLIDTHTFFVHGTDMAISLSNAIERLRMDPVYGVEIPYEDANEILKGIIAATDMEPKVISLSLSGPEIEPRERQAIARANERNIIVLAAAGNDHNKFKAYPASYKLPCLVSVSSVKDGQVPDYANDGEIYVNIFGSEAGTSYSTARANAYVIQYYRAHPKATCVQVKAWLIQQFPRPQLGSTQTAR